jgi:hypothetical protein
MYDSDFEHRLLDIVFADLAQEAEDEKILDALSKIGERKHRIRIDEDGMLRRILPPMTVSSDELDRLVPIDGSPIKILD